MTVKTNLLSSNNFLRQFFTYALIGVLINSLGYIIYLLLTHFWGSPKLVMTLLYLVGALISFLANRRITYRHEGGIGVAGFRYLQSQVAGYLLNMAFLLLFVDWLDFPHQIVQAIAIVTVAIFLFFLQRYYVFASTNEVVKS